MLATAKSRIQGLLILLECNLVRRLSALAVSACSAVCSPGERADAAVPIFEARRFYLSDLAGRKFDTWAAAVQACADNSESFTAALCESLQRVTQNTGRVAQRQLYTLVFTVLTALRMAGQVSERKSPQDRPALRNLSAADLFLAAQLIATRLLSSSERFAINVVMQSSASGCRYLLPLPRSSVPAPEAA